MNQNQNAVAPLNHARFSDVPAPVRNRNLNDAIEEVLSRTDVSAAVEPYITNGGVRGNGILDMDSVRRIVMDAAKKSGSAINVGDRSDWQVCKAVETVLRRRFAMKKHKVIGISAKSEALMLRQAAD